MILKYYLTERLQAEIEGDTHKALFKGLAALSEVFTIDTCGCCKEKDLRFVVRNVDDNDFYELVCQNPKCRAKLAFGQHKKGNTLFPKRKDKDDDDGTAKWLDNGGWTKWVPPVEQGKK